MTYDLHTHSTASDGTLAPAALVERAAAAGVHVLALTDHDCTTGLAAATAAASRCGIRLIPGVEVSVTWGGRTVHIVGLGVDPACSALASGLAQLLEYRTWRAAEIGRRLAQAGFPGALEGARAHSNGTLIGRTHFARFLVERGAATDLRAVFRRFLVEGKPGHVPGKWVDLPTAIGWIRAAGGEAVIAHPARYKFAAAKLRRFIGEFRECGGRGIEVVSGSHSRDDYFVYARHAREHRLLASAGSDYHGPDNPWVELGRLAPLPDGCTPIWSLPGFAPLATAAVA
ncbi:MAG: PHP domain-containing protein [Chromatiaceae bacterium]|nr:MAG: PHP domain-containing protein [Chromatiaceae bacterium]